METLANSVAQVITNLIVLWIRTISFLFCSGPLKTSFYYRGSVWNLCSSEFYCDSNM